MIELLKDIWIIIETFYFEIKPQLDNAITGVVGQYLDLSNAIKRLWVFIPVAAGIIYKVYKKINYV